jgi:hypothetical protein
MDNWIISVILAVVGAIGIFAVTRYITTDNSKRIDAIAKKVDDHAEVLSEHKIIVSSVVTMDQVDVKFITRDLFAAHEKHIDQRFLSLEKKLDSEFSDIKEILKNQ